MVTTNLIKQTCEAPEGFQLKTIVEFLIEIGNESLDPSKDFYTGGAFGIPFQKVRHPKEGKEPFHIKDLVTDKFVPDPRVTMIGRYLHMAGGIELMRSAFYGMKQLGYMGSTRALEWAWHGIGQWKA